MRRCWSASKGFDASAPVGPVTLAGPPTPAPAAQVARGGGGGGAGGSFHRCSSKPCRAHHTGFCAKERDDEVQHTDRGARSQPTFQTVSLWRRRR